MTTPVYQNAKTFNDARGLHADKIKDRVQKKTLSRKEGIDILMNKHGYTDKGARAILTNYTERDYDHQDRRDAGLNEGIFSRKKTFNGKRFPNSDEANKWMSDKVSHYATHQPKELHHLFSPASGDYLPKDVHVGSSFKDTHLAHYRSLKDKHPKAVKDAKDMTKGIAGQVSLSRIGDSLDYHGASVMKEDAAPNNTGGGEVAAYSPVMGTVRRVVTNARTRARKKVVDNENKSK